VDRNTWEGAGLTNRKRHDLGTQPSDTAENRRRGSKRDVPCANEGRRGGHGPSGTFRLIHAKALDATRENITRTPGWKENVRFKDPSPPLKPTEEATAHPHRNWVLPAWWTLHNSRVSSVVYYRGTDRQDSQRSFIPGPSCQSDHRLTQLGMKDGSLRHDSRVINVE